jgi:hypothetical protein
VSDPDVYGRSVSGADVEAAIEATLRASLPAYLGRASRILDMRDGNGELRELRQIQSYRRASRAVFQGQQQRPGVVIVCPGLADRPERHGRWSYSVAWHVGVAVVVDAPSDRGTGHGARAYAQLYAAAIRDCLLQHGALGDLGASGTYWVDEGYDDFPADASTFIGSAQNVFRVVVDNVTTATLGPLEPPDDPTVEPDDWPTVSGWSISANGGELAS